MTCPLPQFRIFAQGTHAHHFLEFDPKPGSTAAQAVGAFRRLRTPDVSAGGVNLVIAFDAEPDATWQSARAAMQAVGPAAELAAEQPAFTYRGGRDITGFVDRQSTPSPRG